MKPLFFIFIFIFIFINTNNATAQIILYGEELNDKQRVAKARVVPADIQGEDTLLQVVLKDIVIFPVRKFKNEKQRIQYTRLMYNVKKVYPYAKMVNVIYSEIETEIANADSKKDVKKYIKEKEKELFDKFEKDLRNMTYSQGRILIKLVDRETGTTTYEVVKELKGSVSAFVWQSVALLFDSNLKLEYNPDEEDKMIEEIIAMIENGLL